MVLTGREILKQMELGSIHIAPFTPAHLGPNSYDVSLNPKLLVYALPEGAPLDMKAAAQDLHTSSPKATRGRGKKSAPPGDPDSSTYLGALL